jgi:hypothetical protein
MTARGSKPERPRTAQAAAVKCMELFGSVVIGCPARFGQAQEVEVGFSVETFGGDILESNWVLEITGPASRKDFSKQFAAVFGGAYQYPNASRLDRFYRCKLVRMSYKLVRIK